MQNFEASERVPIANNLAALQRALEAAGVEFINGDQLGVRLKAFGGAPEGAPEDESASRLGPSLASLSPHKIPAKLTPSQIRAARMMLGWTQEELCRRACLSEPTLVQIERGMSHPKAATLAAIEQALEAAGVEFTNGGEPGVKLRRKEG